MTPETTDEARPLLRVVKGDPTHHELAALVAVLSSLGASVAGTPRAVPRSEWSAHHRKVRGSHIHGPGAWRTSALPR